MIRRVTVALVAIKLWLVSGQLIGALPIAGYDDGLFLALAEHLVNGKWLGPYDIVTLLKPPGYPLWIAANFVTGLPLHLSQHLVYAGACALFVLAIRPGVPSRAVRLAVFAVLLFQPMSFSSSTLRYVRDFLYTTQMLAVLSCVVALLLRMDAPARDLARWSLALGFIGGLLWITRDEGVVLLPALGLAAALLAAGLWRRRQPDWRRRVLPVGLAVPVAASVVVGLSLLNLHHYGFFGTSEFSARPLSDALGALARVEHAQPRRWVIVPTETRERIYPHSAAFRELEAPFVSRLEIWSIAGPMMFDWDQTAMHEEIASGTILGTACHENVDWDDATMRGEIMTGWFVIALREAVAIAGHHGTPSDAMAYFTRLAGEVDDACDTGRLRCGPARSSLAPPWRWEDLGLTLRRTCRGAARLLTLADLSPLQTTGTEDQLATIRALTNDRLAPTTGTPPASAQTELDLWKVARLAEIHRLYAAVLPALAIVAAASVLFLAARPRAWPQWVFLGPVLVLLAAIGARLGLLAYMDATAFPRSLIPLYMLPIYPLLFAFILLLLIDAGRSLLRSRWWSACRERRAGRAGESAPDRCQ